MKYQFCIRFTNIDANSAASKAVADCNKIFLKNGYTDYTFVVGDNTNKAGYYLSLLKELVSFYSSIKKGSIVVIQYPLLSINKIFKHFVKLARLKKIKFYCVIHDLESLRSGGTDSEYIKSEIVNLNFFDCVIAHNPSMMEWLRTHGLTAPAIPLGVFDYLAIGSIAKKSRLFTMTIVFAGNLSKSTFIYLLDKVKAWNFNVYGPNFSSPGNSVSANLKWQGQYSPEEVVQQLDGNFGLIWDGADIEKCDDALGNYLKYNNPHKLSLYIAAGLPVIAPAGSAIGIFIKQHNIGFLIDSLLDLNGIVLEENLYELMKNNVLKIQQKIISGAYLTAAIESTEKELQYS